MSGYSDANMLLAVFLLLGSLSSTLARQLSLFQLAFEEAPKEVSAVDYLGATPAGTYPLVITPLNFAPAVVAPPAFLFPSPIRFPSIGGFSSVRGAIPLFAPLKPFPYVRYLPVKTTFYLSEPNLRDPTKDEDPVRLPFKQGAPKPSFSPVRDTQIVRKPAKKEGISDETIKGETPTSQGMKQVPHFVRVVNFPSVHSEEPLSIPFKQGAPKPSFSPIRDAQIVRRPPQFHEKGSQEKMNHDQQLIRVAHFPTTIGGADFETRHNPELTLSAPGGIVQSGQPQFTFEPFSNVKLSQNLPNENLADIRTENDDVKNLPTLIEV